MTARKTTWITQETLYYMNERSEFVKIFRKTGSPEMYDLCRHLCNKVNRMVRTAKTIYIKSNLKINMNNLVNFGDV